tara:strand:- start:1657 stop:2475 length:819 start_codon:yes stop_codon:yes gene_type:complete
MKNIKLLLVIIITVLLYANVQAQGARRIGGNVDSESGGGREFLELFKMDKNKDGKITKDELPDENQEWIKDYDVDGDGAVSRSEARLIAPSNQVDRSRSRGFSRGGERRGSSGRSSRSGRQSRSGDNRRPSSSSRRPSSNNERSGGLFFQVFDTDKDGEISDLEIRNASQVLFKLDLNGDKSLSRREIGAVHSVPEERAGSLESSRPLTSGRQNFVNRIFEHDKNGDGKVARNELPERMRELLKLGDRDKDDAISRREADQIYRRTSQRESR